ncbi:MAG TPA: hypothetical protein VM840_00305 [Actinomycetota bacterium]|nr:hypothetical protein [Actinomycetota bacterium]
MDKTVNCPNCARELEVPAGAQQVDCPGCGALLEMTDGRPRTVAHASDALRGEERTGIEDLD